MFFKAVLDIVFIENESLQSALLSMVLFGPHCTPWAGLGRDGIFTSQMRKLRPRDALLFSGFFCKGLSSVLHSWALAFKDTKASLSLPFPYSIV